MKHATTLIFAIVSFSTFLSAALADTYEDRARAAEQREYQQKTRRSEEGIYKRNKAYLRQLHAFTSTHSGLAADGACRLYVMHCYGDYCRGGGTGGVLNGWLSQVVPHSLNEVDNCRVNLRNGFACEAESEKSEKSFTVTCYDKANHVHVYKANATDDS